jgi:hypothetical protein
MKIHRRYVRNFLLYPKLQLRYVAMYMSMMAFVLLCLIGLNQLLMARVEMLIENPENLLTFKQWSHTFLIIEIVIFIVTSIFMALLTIVITHRFVGPNKALINYFEDLKRGAPANLYMRQHDGLTPLRDYLKTVDVKVRPKDLLKNEKGMTIAEVLMATMILSVVIVGFAGSMSMFTNDFKKVQSQSAKSDLGTYLRMNSRDYASFLNSAQMPENSELAKCLDGSSASGCTNRAEIPFVYYTNIKSTLKVDSGGNPVLDGAGKNIYLPEPLGGISDVQCPKNSSSTSKSPIFYTNDGRRCNCTDLASTCPIQVVTSFVAYCAGDAATCSQPASLKMNYSVQLRKDLPANSKQVLATSSGYFYAPIQEDHQYFLKFNYASSSDIDVDTGVTVINSAVSEYDIRQGKTLQFLKPSELSVYALFSAPEEVASISLFRYIYPTGCKMSNLGTNTGGKDCTAPGPEKFVLANTQNSFIPTKSLSINIADTVTTNSVVEYKMSIYNAAGSKLLDSKYNLRAFNQTDGTVSVSPPTQVLYNCNPDTTSNIFTFTASSFSGWKNLTVRVSPAQTDGAETLHGFEKFDWANPEPQKITVDPKNFTPGGTYSVTISGTTADNQVRTDTKTFKVKNKPDKILNIKKPVNDSKVRTISNLEVETDINLACDEKPTKVTMTLLKDVDKSVVMPNLDITSNCTAYNSGVADENRFSCVTSLPCTTWLSTSSVTQCANTFNTDTDLDAKASVTDSSGKKTDQKTVSVFTAGSKISVKINADFTQLVLFDSTVVPNPPSTAWIGIDMSSPLIAGETLDVTLKGATSTTNYKCGAGGNSDLDGLTCWLILPMPVNKGDVFTLTTSNPSLVTIGNPKTTTVRFVDKTTLACTGMQGRPTCQAGKTLKAEYKILGNYSVDEWQNDDAVWGRVQSSLQNNTSEMDFFLYYIPADNNTPGLSVALNFGTGGSSNSATDSYIIRMGPTSAPTKCSSDGTSCPADYAYIPTSVFDSRKTLLLSTSQFSIAFLSEPANWSTGWGEGNSGRRMLLSRQCYCK